MSTKLSHHSSLMNNLYKLQQDGILTDIVVTVDGDKFSAHKTILAALSQYFLAMFSGKMIEASSPAVTIKGIRKSDFAVLLKYIYTGELHLTHENCLSVISSAVYLQMESALVEGTNYLKDNLSMANFQSTIDIAELCNLHDLKRYAYDYVSQNLMKQMDQIEAFSPELLEYVLKQDLPIDSDESWLLVCVYTWFNHKYEERLPYARKILQHIRFAAIPMETFDALVENLKAINSRHVLLEVIHTYHHKSHQLSNKTQVSSYIKKRGMKPAILRIGGINSDGSTGDISYSYIGDPTWRQLTHLPATAQWDYATAVLDNHLYIVGGCFEDDFYKSIHANCFRYDPMRSKWFQLPPMGTDRCEFTLSALNGKLYAVGGVTKSCGLAASETKSAECFDISTRCWTPVDSLPETRKRHAAVALTFNGSHLIFVSGGISGDGVIASMFMFNEMTNAWTACAPLLAPRTDHVMFTYQNKIYVCGGWYRGGRSTGGMSDYIKVPTIDAYDIETNTWTHVTTVPTSRYYAGAVVFEGKIYVIGGFCRSFEFRKQSAVECYDIVSDTWYTDAKNAQHFWEHTNEILYVPNFLS